jgi:hypothetical protein
MYQIILIPIFKILQFLTLESVLSLIKIVLFKLGALLIGRQILQNSVYL